MTVPAHGAHAHRRDTYPRYDRSVGASGAVRHFRPRTHRLGVLMRDDGDRAKWEPTDMPSSHGCTLSGASTPTSNPAGAWLPAPVLPASPCLYSSSCCNATSRSDSTGDPHAGDTSRVRRGATRPSTTAPGTAPHPRAPRDTLTASNGCLQTCHAVLSRLARHAVSARQAAGRRHRSVTHAGAGFTAVLGGALPPLREACHPNVTREVSM